jgi:hypothetical protein
MRTLRLVAIAAAAGTLTLGLAACGAKEASPAEAVQNAAKAVDKQASAKVKVDSVDPKEGNTQAEGTLSWKKGAEGAELSMAPGSDADLKEMAGPDGKVHMTMVDGNVYLPLQGEMAEAASGKKWLKFDSSAGEDNPADDLPHGPASALAALSVAADLAKSGEEQVNGAQATHYTGTVDIKKFAANTDVLKLITKDERDAYVEELHDTGLKKTVKIEAWIGDDGLALKTVESGTATQGATKLTITYSGYGKTPAVQAPAAEDVTTLAEMLKNMGAQG